MSQLPCLEEHPPDLFLGPEGQCKSQSGHCDIAENNDKIRGKKVRFKEIEAPENPVEPSCSEEDVELC